MTDTDRTTTILPANPIIADLWRAKAEAPPGPGVQDLLNRIAADCVEVSTEHIDGNTLVQKICIKDEGRIAQMAREAGLIDCENSFGQLIICQGSYNEELVRFARLVAEDCAKVCADEASKWPYPSHGNAAVVMAEKAIRARYSKE